MQVHALDHQPHHSRAFWSTSQVPMFEKTHSQQCGPICSSVLTQGYSSAGTKEDEMNSRVSVLENCAF